MSELQQHWEEFYRSHETVWSGSVNGVLADVVADLPAGTALDLGCGEGGDAMWLAHRGWRVTAVDVSELALGRVIARAAAEGVADRVTTARHDLGVTFPAGAFDLVSAQFLHSPVEIPRAELLRRAAAAVAPGGLLLVVGHADMPPWSHAAHLHPELPSAAEVLADLALDPAAWHPARAERLGRDVTDPDGTPAVLRDAVVAVRRR